MHIQHQRYRLGRALRPLRAGGLLVSSWRQGEIRHERQAIPRADLDRNHGTQRCTGKLRPAVEELRELAAGSFVQVAGRNTHRIVHDDNPLTVIERAAHQFELRTQGRLQLLDILCNTGAGRRRQRLQLVRQILDAVGLRRAIARFQPDFGDVCLVALGQHGLPGTGQIDSHQRGFVAPYGAEDEYGVTALLDDERPERQAVGLAVLEKALPSLWRMPVELPTTVGKCLYGDARL